MNSLIKYLFLVLLLVAFYFLFISKPEGYCSRKKRVLSDKELVNIAIKHKEDLIAQAFQAFKDSQDVDAISKIYIKHPNCCYVSRDEDVADLDDRAIFLGPNSALVAIRYRISDELFKIYQSYDPYKQNKLGSPYYFSKLKVTPCGRVVRGIGKNISESEYNTYINITYEEIGYGF